MFSTMGYFSTVLLFKVSQEKKNIYFIFTHGRFARCNIPRVTQGWNKINSETTQIEHVSLQRRRPYKYLI